MEVEKTLDALICFDITEGEHTLELRYFSNYHKWGIIISLSGLLLTIIYLFVDYKFLRPRLPRKRKNLEKKLELAAKREAERLAIEAAMEVKEACESVTEEATPGVADAESTAPIENTSEESPSREE